MDTTEVFPTFEEFVTTTVATYPRARDARETKYHRFALETNRVRYFTRNYTNVTLTLLPESGAARAANGLWHLGAWPNAVPPRRSVQSDGILPAEFTAKHSPPYRHFERFFQDMLNVLVHRKPSLYKAHRRLNLSVTGNVLVVAENVSTSSLWALRPSSVPGTVMRGLVDLNDRAPTSTTATSKSFVISHILKRRPGLPELS